MIVKSLCNSCFSSFEIRIDPKDVNLLPTIRDENGNCKCPTLCGGLINLFHNDLLGNSKMFTNPTHLTIRELIAAVFGLGIPKERPTDVVFIDTLLKSFKIVKTDITQHKSQIYLNEIHLENGIVLHLTSGARGAHVVKITGGTSAV